MKRLVFRLSSLGDVVLSQSVLEPSYFGETHWVIAKEFEELVQGNPALARIWSYDRKKNRGLSGWLSLLRELAREDFDLVLDAHSTVRTRIARLYFLLCSPRTKWRAMSKERFRRLGYILFKSKWPKSLRPRHLSWKASRLAGGSGDERSNLSWMLTLPSGSASSFSFEFTQVLDQAQKRLSVALVPSSAWPGKEWPTSKYREWSKAFLAQNPGARLYLLGTEKDSAAARLKSEWIANAVPFEDLIGKCNLREIASLLSKMRFTLGSDSGLLHLSEAVGTPVVTIYGPTRSDFGFGPSDSRSVPLDSPLWCSPCSKDGTLCFRIRDRYRCLDEVSAGQALLASEKLKSLNVSRARIEK